MRCRGGTASGVCVERRSAVVLATAHCVVWPMGGASAGWYARGMSKHDSRGIVVAGRHGGWHRDLGRFAILAVGWVITAASGCGGTEPQDGSGAAGTSGAGGSDGPDDVATCAQYVRCVAATNPGALELIREQYGADGSCWSESPELCETACVAGLRQSDLAFPDAVDCPACVADRHCDEAGLPACDRTAGSCTGCTQDHHCPAGTPACDAPAHRCVVCLADEHCPPSAPACDPTQRRCLQCREDAHCPGDTPFCNTATGACRQCRDDSHCGGATPACNTATGFCVACTGPQHCPSGVCNQHSCCTPATCDQLPQLLPNPLCGPQPDPVCGTVIDCGSCTKGYCGMLGMCSTLGEPCASAAVDCYPGEICGYSVYAAQYVCAIDDEGESCSDHSDCEQGTSYCGFGSECHRHCLTTADCPSGQTCNTNWNECEL